MIRIGKFRCNGFEEQAYLVWAGNACVIIDPGFDSDAEFEALHKTLKDNGIAPKAILLTHAHPDHVYGVQRLCGEFGIPVYMNRGEEVTLEALHALCLNIGHPDAGDFSSRIVWVGDGDRISVSGVGAKVLKAAGNELREETGIPVCGSDSPTECGSEGGLEFKVLFTPGHSAGGVCYLCRKVLFSGDTLFAGCIGRSDLPGGDYTALMQSIFTKLLPLDGDIDVLPGHGRATTIADERTKNPFLQPFNEPYEE